MHPHRSKKLDTAVINGYSNETYGFFHKDEPNGETIENGHPSVDEYHDYETLRRLNGNTVQTSPNQPAPSQETGSDITGNMESESSC